MTPPCGESVTSCADDQAVQPWQAEPYRLWSLLDMLQFSANAFFWCGRALRSIRADCYAASAVCIDGEAGFALAQNLDERARKKALNMLVTVERECRAIGMTITADMTQDFINELNTGWSKQSFEWLHTQTDNIERLAEKELKEKTFLYIPAERAKFWPTAKEPDKFGENVARVFPDANRDVAAASRCMALSEWTACVFHSMRVLEHGLRAMATRFNVTFAVDSWHKVIKGIEDGLTDLRNKQNLTELDRKEITHYSSAAAEFRHFKDAWRNHVAHAKEHYDERDAEIVLTHVKSFMQALAMGA